jgi:chemotaxis protein histidine kinase CheA
LSAKSEAVAKMLAKIQPTWEPPTPLEGGTLVENALLCVLVRTLSAAQAEATIKALKQSAADWNELRICQPQELQPLIATKDAARSLRAARDVRDALQEIFQWSHGYELESLREDWVAAGKFVAYLPFLGHRISHQLTWLGLGQKQMPISSAMVRMIDRLAIGERIGSLKKSRPAVEALAGSMKQPDFVLRLGEVIDRWCHAQKPLCHQCPLVDDCVFGRKAFKEWKVQQVRLEQHRKKEEQRREILRQKEVEREQRLAEREKKHREAELAKADRERQRMQREEQRRKDVESKEKARLDEIQRKKAALTAERIEKERQRKAGIEQRRKEAEHKRREAEAKRAAAAKAAAAAKQKALEQKAQQHKAQAEKQTQMQAQKQAQKLAEQKRKEADAKAAHKKDAKKPAAKATKKPASKKPAAKPAPKGSAARKR